MKIIINNKEHHLSEDVKKDVLGELQKFIRSCPLPIPGFKEYNMIQEKSLVPLIFEGTRLLFALYTSVPFGKKLLIMNAARTLLFQMEEHFGKDIRPGKKQDPVEHILGFMYKKIGTEIEKFEKVILPNVQISIETNSNQITCFRLEWDKNLAGGALAVDGNIRIGEDNRGEEDRSKDFSALSAGSPLHSGHAASGGF